MTRSLLVVLFVSFAVGCGRSPAPTATVRGHVTVGGRPVPAGSVLVLADHPRWGNIAMLAADGGYVLTDVPVGRVRVAVRTRGVRRFDHPAAEPVDVPARYEDADTSGLAFDLTAGEQTIDLALPAE